MDDKPSSPGRDPGPDQQSAPAVGGFKSFDATAFFQVQQQQQQEQDVQFKAALEAAAQSSEDEDDSDSSSEEEHLKESGKRSRDSNKEDHKKKHRKKRRKKEKKEQQNKLDARKERERALILQKERTHGADRRSAQVSNWASTASPQQNQVYYSDTKAVLENLAFEGLYRMDIALYKRHDPSGFVKSLTASHGRQQTSSTKGAGVDQSSGRYWGRANRRLEQSTKLKRWRRYESQRADSAIAALSSGKPEPVQSSLPYLPLGFVGSEQVEKLVAANAHSKETTTIPLFSSIADELHEMQKEQQKQLDAILEAQEGETSEQYYNRRNRYFNQALRDNPQDLATWLEFAEVQEQAAKLLTHNNKPKSIAERKISILEKALSHLPGSEDILLALLDTAAVFMDESELDARWINIISLYPGSIKLWTKYLELHKSGAFFRGFSVPEEIARRADAMNSLYKHLLYRFHNTDKEHEKDKNQYECDLVQIILDTLSFLLSTGYIEAAVAGIQILIDFNWFAPDGWPDDALEMMFEECWTSGAALVGDTGAQGWAKWMDSGVTMNGQQQQQQEEEEKRRRREEQIELERKRREEEEIKRLAEEEKKKQTPEEVAAAAWAELASLKAKFGAGFDFGGVDDSQDKPAQDEDDKADGSEQPSDEDDDAVVINNNQEEQPETEEEMIAKLGIDIDAELKEAEQLTPEILPEWIKMEEKKEADNWMPRRLLPTGQTLLGSSNTNSVVETSEIDEVLLAKVATFKWEDVKHWMMKVDSPSARQQLLAGCLSLLGCYNNRYADDDAISSVLQSLGSSVLQRDGDWGWLGIDQDDDDGDQSTTKRLPQGIRNNAYCWYQESPQRREFVYNLLWSLIQSTGEAYNTALVSAFISVVNDTDKSKTLIQQALSEQRDNLVLWRVYAALELGASSNAMDKKKRKAGIKVARKVYAKCLSTNNNSSSRGLVGMVLDAVSVELQQQQHQPSVSLVTSPALESIAAATPAAATFALKLLAWLGSNGSVALPYSASKEEEHISVTADECMAAKRGFQTALLSCMQKKQSMTEDEAGIVMAAAALELLASVVNSNTGAGLGVGVKTALAIYSQVLTGIGTSTSSSTSSCYIQVLVEEQCRLAVSASRIVPLRVSPAAARATLSTALNQHCPGGSVALYQLLINLELESHALSMLRREIHLQCDKDNSSGGIQAWLAAIAVEIVGCSPGRVVQSVMERAVTSSIGRQSPLLWRCYLRFEAYRGRYRSVQTVFRRAVTECPWSKALWIDGLALLNNYAPARELTAYLDAMNDKDIVVRTDVLEVAVAMMDE